MGKGQVVLVLRDPGLTESRIARIARRQERLNSVNIKALCKMTESHKI
jgi:hypothetical protein